MNIEELLKDFDKNFPLIDKDLELNPSYESLEKEFFWFLDHKGKLSSYCANNMIIKAFQQDMFYIIEKELWKNEKIKIKLIENRCKYLNKQPLLVLSNSISTNDHLQNPDRYYNSL